MRVRLLRRVADVVVPSVIVARDANRLLEVPGLDRTQNAARLDREIASLAQRLEAATPEQRELVLLSVAAENERLNTLESKGFAVTALPFAITAVAVLLIGHGVTATCFAVLTLIYVCCAVWSAIQIYHPRPRVAFGMNDTLAADSLVRLQAASNVNQNIGTVVNNHIYSVLMDSVRAFCILAIGGVVLGASSLGSGADEVGHQSVSPAVTVPGNTSPNPTPSLSSSASSTPTRSTRPSRSVSLSSTARPGSR
jgi:hypothetical protein